LPRLNPLQSPLRKPCRARILDAAHQAGQAHAPIDRSPRHMRCAVWLRRNDVSRSGGPGRSGSGRRRVIADGYGGSRPSRDATHYAHDTPRHANTAQRLLTGVRAQMKGPPGAPKPAFCCAAVPFVCVRPAGRGLRLSDAHAYNPPSPHKNTPGTLRPPARRKVPYEQRRAAIFRAGNVVGGGCRANAGEWPQIV
jgi:hypothetical protein